MPGAQLDPSDVAATARILRDLTTRVERLEVRVPLGQQAVESTGTYFYTSSGTFIPSGPEITLSVGVSGRVLVVISGTLFVGSAQPDTQRGSLALQYSSSLGTVTPTVGEDDLQIQGAGGASRVIFLDGLTPYDDLTLTLLARTQDANIIGVGTPADVTFTSQSLVAVPL